VAPPQFVILLLIEQVDVVVLVQVDPLGDVNNCSQFDVVIQQVTDIFPSSCQRGEDAASWARR